MRGDKILQRIIEESNARKQKLFSTITILFLTVFHFFFLLLPLS